MKSLIWSLGCGVLYRSAALVEGVHFHLSSPLLSRPRLGRRIDYRGCDRRSWQCAQPSSVVSAHQTWNQSAGHVGSASLDVDAVQWVMWLSSECHPGGMEIWEAFTNTGSWWRPQGVTWSLFFFTIIQIRSNNLILIVNSLPVAACVCIATIMV